MTSNTTPSGTFTADFRAEFDASTGQLLRQQFVWFAGITGVAGLLFCAYDLTIHFAGTTLIRRIFTSLPSEKADQAFPWMAVAFTLAFVGAHVAAITAVTTRPYTAKGVELLTIGLVLFDSIAQMLVRRMGIVPEIGFGAWGSMWTHTLAAIFLPWTNWQAVRAALALWGAYALITVTYRDAEWSTKLLRIGFFPVLTSPGVFIAWLKHSRRYEQHKMTFFQRRYADVRRELVDARRIHEALFPPQKVTQHLRFSYEYEPMRQIGGDYLYANWFGPRGRHEDTLNVVLMDVTGHGIPAALTVNRLHGELERVFAENPEIPPGEVLELLNRYVHLTLATHSVFVTALCLKVDILGNKVEYASGGHPPAFLRTVDGKIHELPSTTFVLGACGGREFDPDPRSVHFGPGDVLIAYTDGAIEARDRMGKMLGIKGVQKLVAFGSPDAGGGWTRTLRSAVEGHRHGPPADDTLVVEIARVLHA
ncbi:MAG: serine/threonine-protein phosphatase [Phycisphaeraceae bacterium]|nr:serine/threonine-protein phosphatase [Phycisphaerae bacterium]MBX3392022.1 serine/threonine-protein phosphatase [Phycisphaeraceae bacterium]